MLHIDHTGQQNRTTERKKINNFFSQDTEFHSYSALYLFHFFPTYLALRITFTEQKTKHHTTNTHTENRQNRQLSKIRKN